MKIATAVLIAMLILLLSLMPVRVRAESSAVFPAQYSTIPIFLDGQMNIKEWSDARLATNYISPNQQGRFLVFAKYDNASGSLYLGLYMDDDTPVEQGGDRVDIGFDINHDGGLKPNSDDFLIVVSRDNTVPEHCVRGNGTDYSQITCSSFPYQFAVAKFLTSSYWSVEVKMQSTSQGAGVLVAQVDRACLFCPDNRAGIQYLNPSTWPVLEYVSSSSSEVTVTSTTTSVSSATLTETATLLSTTAITTTATQTSTIVSTQTSTATATQINTVTSTQLNTVTSTVTEPQQIPYPAITGALAVLAVIGTAGGYLVAKRAKK